MKNSSHKYYFKTLKTIEFKNTKGALTDSHSLILQNVRFLL